MIRPTAEVAVYLCIEPVDMRKQAATLALLVEQSLGRAVFDGGVYAFANRKRDRVKLLTWERNGLVLWSKRRRCIGCGPEPSRRVWRIDTKIRSPRGSDPENAARRAQGHRRHCQQVARQIVERGVNSERATTQQGSRATRSHHMAGYAGCSHYDTVAAFSLAWRFRAPVLHHVREFIDATLRQANQGLVEREQVSATGQSSWRTSSHYELTNRGANSDF